MNKDDNYVHDMGGDVDEVLDNIRKRNQKMKKAKGKVLLQYLYPGRRLAQPKDPIVQKKMCEQSGLPLHYIQQILGHSSITTTEIYAHPKYQVRPVKLLQGFSTHYNTTIQTWR